MVYWWQFVPTKVRVGEKTLQMLDRLKKELGVKSHDEVIRRLTFERRKIPSSMFGSNPKLRSFSREDETEFHES